MKTKELKLNKSGSGFSLYVTLCHREKHHNTLKKVLLFIKLKELTINTLQ